MLLFSLGDRVIETITENEAVKISCQERATRNRRIGGGGAARPPCPSARRRGLGGERGLAQVAAGVVAHRGGRLKIFLASPRSVRRSLVLARQSYLAKSKVDHRFEIDPLIGLETSFKAPQFFRSAADTKLTRPHADAAPSSESSNERSLSWGARVVLTHRSPRSNLAHARLNSPTPTTLPIARIAQSLPHRGYQQGP